MSNQKMEPFESRLSKHYPEQNVTSRYRSGLRVIVIPLPEDYEGPGLGEECEYQSGDSWSPGGKIEGVEWSEGQGVFVKLRVGGWIPLDRIRRPSPQTVEINGRHYSVDDVQRVLEVVEVEPVEES